MKREADRAGVRGTVYAGAATLFRPRMAPMGERCQGRAAAGSVTKPMRVRPAFWMLPISSATRP